MTIYFLLGCVAVFASFICYAAANKASLRLLIMYQSSNQQKPEFITEPVSPNFAKAWNGEPFMPAIVVSRITDGVCVYSKYFGSPTILRRTGIYVTYPASNICSNPDPNNSSLLMTDFRLNTQSHLLSYETTTKIIRLIECCRAFVMAAALSQSAADDAQLSSQENILLMATSGTASRNQPAFNNSNNNTLTFLSKNSIFFVAVSFIVLMIISLGWLAFYYVERFRNAHTKEYISKRIAKAAKKALAKMPIKTVRGNGTDDVNYQSEKCTVCIENFRQHDTIRILPCKHVYHKMCIDPWLIENHTCPMCKLDILTASGFELPYSRYHCDLEPSMPGRQLELYPVQLDLLIHAGDTASPASSGSADQEIQLVHIRPPVVQVHSAPRFCQLPMSRRSSESSASPPYGKVDEDEPASKGHRGRSVDSSSTEEMSRLLGKDELDPKPSKSADKKARHVRRAKKASSSKNVACVVDVIAPATPPLETELVEATEVAVTEDSKASDA